MTIYSSSSTIILYIGCMYTELIIDYTPILLLL